MALTSVNTAARKAERRRDYHQGLIDDSARLATRIWRAAGWLVSEAKRRPVDEQGEAVDQLVEIARDLNGRNADDRN